MQTGTYILRYHLSFSFHPASTLAQLTRDELALLVIAVTLKNRLNVSLSRNRSMVRETHSSPPPRTCETRDTLSRPSTASVANVASCQRQIAYPFSPVA